MLNCSWLAEIHHQEKGTARNAGRGRAFSSLRDHLVCPLLRVFYNAMVTPITAIRLPAALEKFIASQVREGRYRSREAAIVAAVLHLKQRSEQLVWLRTEIQNGLDSGAAGELNIEGTVRRGRRRLAARTRRARR
jgi:putative addiction module CopG family antidote